jgi:predicted enzyme related to lactoylglutathione lyase
MPARVTHFEIPVDDPARAEKFYSTVFGWTIQAYPGAPQYYGLATTGDDSQPGINGALFQRGENNATTVTVSVDSIEDSIAAIEQGGGSVVTGKAAVPTMGWFAVCEDTEGNRIGLWTDDPNAG